MLPSWLYLISGVFQVVLHRSQAKLGFGELLLRGGDVCIPLVALDAQKQTVKGTSHIHTEGAQRITPSVHMRRYQSDEYHGY